MDRPKLSVIIPTKNHAHLLEECLSSLSKQEFRDFEVVVVDGHSTDHTAEVARRYGARIVYEDYGTRAGACLVGFREARGEILVYTDDDCTFPPDWLKRVEEAFRKDRELQVYGGEDVIPPNSSYFEKALFQLDLAKGPPKKPHLRLRGCNVAYRREALEQESFNPSLTGIEETELHYRMARRGMKMVFDPSLFVYHKRRGGFLPLFRRMYSNGLARVQVIRLHRGLVEAMDLLPPLTLLLTLLVLLLSPFSLLPLKIWVITIILYFLSKSLYVTVKSKGFSYFPLLLPVLVVRELSFGMGIIKGMLSGGRG
ncbi:MAG: hypothetical protein DSO02_00845 [Hadesarchaea archaeon]|nr:MAG: hypothetical protein DSO03_02550 [Hadesarchaea archaeon]TDA35992.1 MAG: hypothetical protein DSO02_00845 [Hadesarchaea archaeon]